MSRSGVDQARVARLLAAERARFAASHPRALEFARRAEHTMLYGVPVNWMTRWASPVPIVVAQAKDAEVEDIDGHRYVDLCLGDTGAMAGHAPARSLKRWPGRSPAARSSSCITGATTVRSTRRWPASMRRGAVIARAGSVGPALDVCATTRVVEINDLGALQRALADRAVACVLIEPALTNIGIVLPDPE